MFGTGTGNREKTNPPESTFISVICGHMSVQCLFILCYFKTGQILGLEIYSEKRYIFSDRLTENSVLLRRVKQLELQFDCNKFIVFFCFFPFLLVAQNKNSPTEEPRPHSLSNHNYKTPTFCDHCGAMLLGLFNQGVKCENCGLNFHRKCIPLYPNNCSHSARRRRSSTNLINFGPGSSSNLPNV